MRDEFPTISPAVLYRFEKLASRICDEALVDFEERPLIILEYKIRLIEFFRKAEREGLDDERAAGQAIDRFGNPTIHAKVRRGGFKGWLRRLLTYRRYRTARFLVIIFTAQFIEYLRVQSGTTYVLNEFTLLLHGSNILEGVGVCVCLVGSKTRSGTWPLLTRLACRLGAIWLQGSLFENYFETMGRLFGLWKGSVGDWVFVTMLVGCLPLIVLSCACLVSEGLEWPEKAAARKVERR